jgi:hypothetical protein
VGTVPVSIGVSFPESLVPGTPPPDIAGLAGLAEPVGADLIVVVCDPAPSPRSWELLAEVRLLMR